MNTENPFIPSVLAQQDLAELQYSGDLRRNQAGYNSFKNERINTLTSDVFNRKRVAYQKADIDLKRYMDMDHNAALTAIRTEDATNLATKIQGHNDGLKNSMDQDVDLSRRQFEMNEWANYNKLETLFFLQILFISSLSLGVILFLYKNNTLTNTIASLLVAVIGVVVVASLVYRYYFTSKLRDGRLWHRRKFEEDVEAGSQNPKVCYNASGVPLDGDGSLTIDLNAIIPKPLTQCADSRYLKFKDWQNNLKAEMQNFQTVGSAPVIPLISKENLCSNRTRNE